MTNHEKDVHEDARQDEEVSEDTAVATTDDAVLNEMDDDYNWAEPPKFDIEHKEDCVCEVQVTIPAANIKAMLDEVYEEVNDGVQVPGFRRGKAPRKLLEKRLGKYARSTVAERLAEHASKRLVAAHNLVPIAKADVIGLEDTENLSEDQDMVYTITFDTPGKCDLGDYKNIEIKKPELEVADKDVDEAIEGMRVRFGRYEPLEDGVAQDGDQLIITFKGTVDGEEFEGNSAENYPYILGSKRFGDEMEEAMCGAKTGQTVTAAFDFPEDHRDSALAGKTAQYEITVNEIKRRVLPEIDEEFVKKVGFDSVEALREGIRDRISQDANERIQDYMNQQALAALIEGATFALPKSQISRFTEIEYESMVQRLVEQHVPAEEVATEQENLQKAAAEQALFSLKSMYAVSALAEAEGIGIEESDFDAYARRLSQGNEQHYEMMRQYVVSDEVRNTTEFRILEVKALEWLVANAKVVVTPLTDDEDTVEGVAAVDDEEKKDE